jgi:aconitate hydratase
MSAPTGGSYRWDPDSTYVQEPPYFHGLEAEPAPLTDIERARTLVVLGDSVTTDHISPAGTIAPTGPAGLYLAERGVPRAEFNSFGSRRGNHEVKMRGTFANIRLRNLLAGGREGWWTRHLPSGDEMTIFDAAARYRAEGVPLVVIAGKEYGSGSSRDWAAKGPNLLGVRAVIAESFERIHRSNLVGMGVLPLQFAPGASRESLSLTGEEELSIRGIAAGPRPRQELEVEARSPAGVRRFTAIARVDNQTEVDYLRHGGVLNLVLRQVMSS